MRRRERPLDPAVEAELAALDRVLSTTTAPALEDRELATLVQDVRAQRAVPDPAFLAGLEQRVVEGFAPPAQPALVPRRRGWGRRSTGWLAPRILAPAAGLLAAAIVAVVLMAGGGDASRPSGDVAASSSGSSASGPAAESQVAPAPSASGATTSSGTAADSAAAAAPVPETAAKAVAPSASADASVAATRRVVRDAQLTLSAPRDRVASVSDAIAAATTALGGYVASAQVSASGSVASATMSLRVPSNKLEQALTRFGRLARVTSLSRGSTDITGTYDSARDLLADARAERQALLRALDGATTASQIASLQQRLRGVRARIASREASLQSVRRQAAFATIAVELQGRAPAGIAPAGRGSWTPGDAVRDAGRGLEVVAGVLIIAAAALVPAGLLAALAIGSTRAMRRRRREVALDRS